MYFNTKPERSLIKTYRQDTGGQFAVWFGVAAFPLLVATSFVIDFRGTEANRDAVKRALDVAVLAAVSNDKVDKFGKKDIAIDVFNTHYTGSAELDLSVDVSDGRVAMNATGMNAATLARAVGTQGFKVDETSIAEMTRKNTICVMALADEGKGKLRFLNSTEFNSPTCSVQSNSQDAEGVLSASRYTPVAKSFCSAGGATGSFTPAMRGECRVVEDPYVERAVPDSGVCMPESLFTSAQVEAPVPLSVENVGTPASMGHEPGLQIKLHGNGWHTHQHCHAFSHASSTGHSHPRCHNTKHRIKDKHYPAQTGRLSGLGISAAEVNRLESDYGIANLIAPESLNYTGSNGVFYPGTYCGGLTVDGLNVTFMPGIYIMKDGPLTFKNGASAYAEDVSFILKGTENVVTVESGSFVHVKAPRDGAMAGLAFYQDSDGDAAPVNPGGGTIMQASRMARSASSDQAPQAPNSSGYPTAVNLISSGGELNVTGTMYFPTQALEVVGNSVLGARAPATSFIAHQVTFAGETKASISVDYVKGKIPAMQPLSDDGARLVR